MSSRPTQSSSHNNQTGYTNPITDARSTAPALCPQTGATRKDDDLEMTDSVQRDEGNSEDDDKVVETQRAESESGKESVYHYEIYNRLVNLMDKQRTCDLEPPDDGVDIDDITSFHPDQRDWTHERSKRPHILTLWSKSPELNQTYRVGFLLFNGRLILDYKGTPIRAFRNLPLTISSAVKAFRLETWFRQDFPRLQMADVIARMKTETLLYVREPLMTERDLWNRVFDFRNVSGLVSFGKQKPGQPSNRYVFMDSLRTPAQKANNQAIDRDLTEEELAAVPGRGRPYFEQAVATESSSNAVLSTPAAVSASNLTGPLTPSHHRLPSAFGSTPTTPLTTVPDPTLPDSREDEPKSQPECDYLEAALEPTIRDFTARTTQVPKPTSYLRSYSFQWNELQAQYAPLWWSQRPAEKRPVLFKLCRWTGGIACWTNGYRIDFVGMEREIDSEESARDMEATRQGTAYLRWAGEEPSARDTGFNSHGNSAEDQRIGGEFAGVEGFQDDLEEYLRGSWGSFLRENASAHEG